MTTSDDELSVMQLMSLFRSCCTRLLNQTVQKRSGTGEVDLEICDCSPGAQHLFRRTTVMTGFLPLRRGSTCPYPVPGCPRLLDLIGIVCETPLLVQSIVAEKTNKRDGMPNNKSHIVPRSDVLHAWA